MRTLRFIVDGQKIKHDPECDFSGLVPGTEGYLQAEFVFSKEWNGCVKVATFLSRMGREYPPQALKDGKTCIIPAEALRSRKFQVGVIGQCKGYKITTHTVEVWQNGGKE